MWARRAVIRGAVAGPDGSEADDLSQVADRLEQRAAAGAQIADHVIRACRTVQARLARYAFEVGHQDRFRSESQRTIYERQI
jgi:hypothetical protein